MNQRSTLLPLLFIFLMLGISSCSKIPQEILDSYFQSPGFVNIFMAVIPENNTKQLEVKKISDERTAIKGPFSSEQLYKCNLERQIGPQNDSFYAFLKENGYMLLNEYSSPYERDNVPGVIFANYIQAFHEYAPQFKESLISKNNTLYSLVARRKLEKVTYENKYTQNIMGVNTTIMAVTFQYSIKSSFSQMQSPSGLYEGKLTFVHDPNDGKWKLNSQELKDNGNTEITKLISNNSLKDYFATRRGALNDEVANQRLTNIEKAERKEIIIKVLDNKEYGGFSSYLGLISTDYAVKIEPVSGQYNKVSFFLADRIKSLPKKYKIGDTLKADGLGGSSRWWKSSGHLFYDIQKHERGQSRVTPKCLLIKLFGEVGATAKVTVYRVDNAITPSALAAKTPDGWNR